MQLSMVDWVNDVSGIWWQWATRSILESVLLLLILVVTWAALRRRMQPVAGYWLFMLIPLKLAIPISIVVPMAIAQCSPSNWILQPAAKHSAPTAMIDDVPQTGSESLSVSVSQLGLLPDQENPIPSSVNVPAAKTLGEFEQEVRGVPVNLRPSALLMLAWLVVVILLLSKFVANHVRFLLRLKQDSSDAKISSLDMNSLMEIAAIEGNIPVLASSQIAAPAVCGIAKPTILVSPRLESALSADQLRWTIFHELAHVKRHDVLISLLQRLINIIHFFNPVIWVVNRWLHRQREYICDDMAEQWASLIDNAPKPTLASEAFLQTIAFAQSNPIDPALTLSILGLGPQTAHRDRIVRLLDDQRTRSHPMRKHVALAIFCLAMVAIPQLRAEPEEKADESRESISLKVVDARGASVPNCNVRWRVYPAPGHFDVLQGELVEKKGKSQFNTVADEQGVVRCAFPASDVTFEAFVNTDGYGPYCTQWDAPKTGEKIPSEFTIELDDAWTVGGVLVNEVGEPIANAEVHPSLEFKKRKRRQLGVGTRLTTDAEGRWQFGQVPVSKRELTVQVHHERYKPFYVSLSRDKYGLDSGATPSETIIASKGLSIVGIVTDANDKPIEGALVRTEVRNDVRETITDAEGRYELSGFEPQTSRVVVSADSFALDMKDVRVQELMEPVNFAMQPGGHVKVRVLDENGKGIPKARIFFHRWRNERIEYFEFDHIESRTDEYGIWEWNEAPLDTFHADICRPDGMQLSKQALLSRPEEYVFRPPPQLIVFGKVVGAKTKKPVTKFRVVPGIQGSEGSHINWILKNTFHAKDGSYRLPHDNHSYFAHLVRIEADGYLPKVSRDIQFDEETVEINFELDKGQDLTQFVRDSNGQPASNAEVVLGVAGSQINIENGRLDGGSTYNATNLVTDEKGAFRFPPQITPFHLIVLHEKGFAHIESEPGVPLEPIELEPWAVVKGTYRVGSTPAVNTPLTASNGRMHSSGEKVPNIFTHYETTTGKDGGFVFDRIPAGDVRVRREIVLMVKQGATEVASTPVQHVVTRSGQATEMQLGGQGLAVEAQLLLPDGVENVDWRHASVWVEQLVPIVPHAPVPDEIRNDREKRKAWMNFWKRTPAGRVWSDMVAKVSRLETEKKIFYATVDNDGRVHIDDIPVGSYRLRASLDSPEMRASLSNFEFEITESDKDTKVLSETTLE